MFRRLFLLFCTLHLLSGCSEQRSAVEIPFEARFDGQPLSCEMATDKASLTDLRFYVYNAYLLDANGSRVPLALTADGRWQSGAVALLDLEDGSGSCINGTAPTNNTLRGTVRGQEFTGLGFVIGVPEFMNHSDPLLAEAPLTDTPMHWHWRSGYKFLRVGMKTAADGFWMHVGSARCEGTIGNLKGCRSSNRVVVELPDFKPGQDAVVLDLQLLLELTDLTDARATDCSSGPDETECTGPFRMLGIDFDSGEMIRPAPSFTVRTQD